MGESVAKRMQKQATKGIMTVEKVAKQAIAGAMKQLAKAKRMVKAARTRKQKKLASEMVAAAKAGLQQAQVIGSFEVNKMKNESAHQVKAAKKLQKQVVSIRKVKLQPGDRIAVRKPCKTSGTSSSSWRSSSSSSSSSKSRHLRKDILK